MMNHGLSGVGFFDYKLTRVHSPTDDQCFVSYLYLKTVAVENFFAKLVPTLPLEWLLGFGHVTGRHEDGFTPTASRATQNQSGNVGRQTMLKPPKVACRQC
jgi:hypothetical protein